MVEHKEGLTSMLNAGDQILGPYLVVKTLGEGASGCIYLVRDLRYPGAVFRALKELPGDAADRQADREINDLFERETDILGSLNHPGLPKLTDSFSLGSSRCIVMEYIEGETLQDIIMRRRHSFTPEEVIPWALQIARILAYLHGQGPCPVIFRDLKPSNIMLTAGGRIKLIDFGIARYFRSYKSRDTYFMGTPGFAAPEQYGRAQSDARSDIFAFGATLYHLLTIEDMEAFNFNHPDLARKVPDIPEWLNRLVMQCLHRNPGNRIQSAAEMVDILESLGNTRAKAGPASIAAPGMPMGIVHWCAVAMMIAILAGILAPNFLRARACGSLTGCKSNTKNIGTAMEMYSSDNQGRYPLTLNQITPNYLRTLPTCPDAGKMTYAYVRREKPDNYTAYCSGNYHKGRMAAGFPQYDAVQGLYDH
jgi:serine/threonine protein kinase